MAHRICAIDGCDRPHRARGMCAMHYNAWHREQFGRRVSKTSCVVCGTTVTRPPDKARRTCCSVECRTVLQWGAPGWSDYDWAETARQRARDAGAQVIDHVDRDAVFERDAWLCYLCGCDTKLAESSFDPRFATVDHVMPLSRGGEHTMANVRCCCLGCNSSKKDAVLPIPA